VISPANELGVRIICYIPASPATPYSLSNLFLWVLKPKLRDLIFYITIALFDLGPGCYQRVQFNEYRLLFLIFFCENRGCIFALILANGRVFGEGRRLIVHAISSTRYLTTHIYCWQAIWSPMSSCDISCYVTPYKQYWHRQTDRWPVRG
jgi:hypothetical protein